MSLMSQLGLKTGFAIDMRMKKFFFDRSAIKNDMDKATHQAMRRGAGAIRLTAQRSMRYVSRGSTVVSRPGQPPRARRPHPWLRAQLWYYYDRAQMVAVIGPVKLPIAGDVPHILEFGGRLRGKNPRRRKRVLGGGGEIRIARVTHNPVKGVDVFYGKLFTQAQVDRANQLNALLYGPEQRSGTLEARPYMGPALEKVAPSLPYFWSKSVVA